MSPVTILRNVQPTFDFHIQGGYPTEAATSGISAAAALEYGVRSFLGLREGIQGAAPPRPPFGSFIQFTAGAPNLTERVTTYRGLLALMTSVTVAAEQTYSFGGMAVMPITDNDALTPGYVNPSWRRVFWAGFALAMDSGTLGVETGLLFIPFGADQNVTVWPTGAVENHGGWGITGDGAGGWQWGSYGLGAFPGNIIEEVALPQVADAEDWNLFEFIIRSGTPELEASVELRINGASILTRDWVTAPALVDYAATEFAFHPSFRIATPSGDRLIRGPYDLRNGRFLPDGQEVLA